MNILQWEEGVECHIVGGGQDLYLFSDMAEKELNTFSDGECVSK